MEISSEQIGRAEADWILYGTYGDPGKTQQAGVLGGPLWPALGVLAADSVRTDLRTTLNVRKASTINARIGALILTVTCGRSGA